MHRRRRSEMQKPPIDNVLQQRSTLQQHVRQQQQTLQRPHQMLLQTQWDGSCLTTSRNACAAALRGQKATVRAASGNNAAATAGSATAAPVAAWAATAAGQGSRECTAVSSGPSQGGPLKCALAPDPRYLVSQQLPRRHILRQQQMQQRQTHSSKTKSSTLSHTSPPTESIKMSLRCISAPAARHQPPPKHKHQFEAKSHGKRSSDPSQEQVKWGEKDSSTSQGCGCAADSTSFPEAVGVADPWTLSCMLTSWAASNASTSISSVHTPLASGRMRKQKDFSVSPPRKKIHTAATRRHKNSTDKPSAAATAAAAATCGTRELHEPGKTNHQQLQRQERGQSGSSRPAATAAKVSTAAVASASNPASGSSAVVLQQRRQHVRQSVQQQQQHMLQQQLLQEAEPAQGTTHQELHKNSSARRMHHQVHQQRQSQEKQPHRREKKTGWRLRHRRVSSTEEWKGSERCPSAVSAHRPSLHGCEVYAQLARLHTAQTRLKDTPSASISHKIHQMASKELHWSRRGQQQQKQQQQQQPNSAVQQHHNSQETWLPRQQQQNQQQQQQLLLPLNRLRIKRGDEQQSMGSVQTAAAQTAVAEDDVTLDGYPEFSPSPELKMLSSERLLLFPEYLLQPQQEQRQEESWASLSFCSAGQDLDESAAEATAAPAEADAAAVCEGKKGFSWPHVPLGVRLLICSFLGEMELRALLETGREGREAVDHPHIWMLRCTRRLCPCLASTAARTAALPVGRSQSHRQSLRNNWSLEQHQRLCGRVPTEEAQREAETAKANPSTQRTAMAAGAESSTDSLRSTKDSFSSSTTSWQEALWESWALQNLNDENYRFDYKRLFLDRNGWFPRGGRMCRWSRITREANPRLVNTMDARQHFGCLYLASESSLKTGGFPSSQLQVLSLRDLSVQRRTFIASRAINCLDLDSEVLVCGDDNGVVQIFNPFSLKLRGRHAASGVSSLALVYSVRGTQEINDLRVCATEKQILAVRTARRYPAGLDLIDIETGTKREIPPKCTDDHWIHAVDVDTPPYMCPYTSRSGPVYFPGCCCNAGGSSCLRSSSSSNVFAVGESFDAGSFALLRLDFRLDKPVVQQLPQNKRMLWPLRMDGHRAFVNAVFGPRNYEGRIHQVDMRMPVVSSVGSSSSWSWPSDVTSDTSVAAPGGLLHLLPHKRVEDMRVYDGQVYVLANDEEGELCILRFDAKAPKEAEMICPVDTFKAAEWAEPLRLLLVYEQGWTATYGNYVTVGRMADPSGPLPEEDEPLVMPPLYSAKV